jgi:hypothetical protein
LLYFFNGGNYRNTENIFKKLMVNKNGSKNLEAVFSILSI